MTSIKQIEANRRNARSSTGPTTQEGKLRSRRNAVRHGLTAETVISALEDAEDYKGFEASIIADYDAQSAVERDLVLRLASLLWRLRRATIMETGLFEIQASHLRAFRMKQEVHAGRNVLQGRFNPSESCEFADTDAPAHDPSVPDTDLAQCFLRLANLPNYALDRLSRYEAALWRQAAQVLFTLNALDRRKPWERKRRLPSSELPQTLYLDEDSPT